ncbi:bifunctional DNA primase/polymerase [Pseudonocardia sp. WMMC193]|uniref:bifunctional DNA primase/polymerase n=1 Tax=Pseudonocardia sp. WMMC193 TaxID=2911965 RepID=UPI001F20F29C|nr:bifunctional DNA primase/polymerase [Pseudonocardia sp. WMMC193]MCF7548914.1 bifunctional DNA primase/polymerase [Pseudonocardia sp. WMMC193]
MNVAELIPAYARAGMAVLPLHGIRNGVCTCGWRDCHSPGKHPRTAHGKDDATTDLGTIAEWLAAYPDGNWGVRPTLGYLVLDVDVRSGGPPELAKLDAERGGRPPTLTARTGSGGYHYWYRYSGPARGRLCRGVDVKTNTGYLVVPPSLHACGERYEWTDWREPAGAPGWVKAIVNPPVRCHVLVERHAQRGLDPLVRFVSESQPGERSNRLYWAAIRAHREGLDLAALHDAAVATGLAPSEAQATIRSAANAAPRRKAA